MKKTFKLICLMLALLLALGAAHMEAAPADETAETAEITEEVTEAEATEEAAEAEATAESEERVVLMSVGGENVYKDEVEYYSQLTYMYYQYGMLGYYFDELDSLQYLLLNDVGAKLLTAGRVEELLGEGYDEAVIKYGAEFDSYVDEQVAEIKSQEGFEGTDEDAEKQALEYYASMGYTRDYYINQQLTADAYRAYQNSLEPEVSDDEIMTEFARLVEEDRAAYEGNVGAYEYNVMYQGGESYWTPEGYRGILHILISADEDLLNAYEQAEEGEAKQLAAEAVKDSVKDTLDEIYAAIDAGTPFEELIPKYNIDPGMQNEDNLKTGYQVHANGIMYVDEFTKGSFSEKMQMPGDVSEPVVTNYGVHILYYLNDVPGGAKELTDEIRQSIHEDLVAEARYQAILEQLRQYEVVYYPAYAEYIGEKNFLDD